MANKLSLAWMLRLKGLSPKKELTSIDLVLRQMGGHTISEDIEFPRFFVASKS